MARYKSENTKLTVGNAISVFYEELQSLAEDIQESLENVPESLQNTERNQTMGETADALENLQEPDAPDGADGLLEAPVIITLQVRGGAKRGRESRSIKRDNAVAHAQAAVDAIRAWIDEQDVEETDDDSELQAEARANLAEAVEAVSSFCDEVEEAIGEAEGCEFPGMRG